jgi:HAD superfamily phosphoserine phosphatase-like hydrolase
MNRRDDIRPFAAFDIDGTLIRWQLYHAVSDQLAKTGKINALSFQAVQKARLTWKKRTAHNSYDDYERALIKAYDSAITNISEADLFAAEAAVFNQYKDQTYTYTRDLLRRLKKEGYWLFAISASMQEIVEMLARYYGFDDFGGSTYENIGGRFTGRKNILISKQKPAYLRKLIAARDCRTANCI